MTPERTNYQSKPLELMNSDEWRAHAAHAPTVWLSLSPPGNDCACMTDAPPAPLPESSALLAGERVAFTGTLASMTHREAAELVEQHGGAPVQNISQLTTLLVIGEEGWPLEPDGQPSVKLLQAQALQERGSPLRFLSESEWLSALGLEPRTKTQQLYTPAMLSQLLGVSVHEIRRWERLRLIRPVRRVMRLPYFDVADVTAARRLAELVASGASLEHVARTFEQLQAVMPDLQQPLAQLQILAQGREVLLRDAGGWLDPRTGQRRLPFFDDVEAKSATATVTPAEADDDDVPDVLPLRAPATSAGAAVDAWTPEDLFERGCQLAEADRLEEAVEAYRAAIIERPTTSEYHFHLADALYRLGQPHAAVERYYAAVEHDHDFIEAWTQLGCLLVETRNLPAAREAFQIALDRHPEFPDAHFHLAQVLERLGDTAAARPHWTAYLEYDSFGPWADVARQRLSEPVG